MTEVMYEDIWYQIGDYEFARHEGTIYVTSFKKTKKWESILEETLPHETSLFKGKRCLGYYSVDMWEDLVDALNVFNEEYGLFIQLTPKEFIKLLKLNGIRGYGPFYTKKNFSRYHIKGYSNFRNKVLQRDNHECICCKNNANLQVHHIYPVNNYFERVLDVSNGVTLCEYCHKKYHELYPSNTNPITLMKFLGGI